MLKRLILKSKKYLYVFHSGDFTGMRFMGMTKDAYNKARGFYKVWCFPCTNNTLRDTIANIEDDFDIGEKQGISYRNISMGVKVEDAIDCAKEFYEEAYINSNLRDLQVKYYLVDKVNSKGILYNNFKKVDFYTLKVVDIMPNLDSSAVVDFSSLLREDMEFGKKLAPYRVYISRCYGGDSRYCIIGIAEGIKTSFVELQLNVDVAQISNISSVERLFKLDSNYSFQFNDERYFLS